MSQGIERSGGEIRPTEVSKAGASTSRQIVVYFVTVFTLTWGVAAVLLASPSFLTQRFGPVRVDTPFYAGAFFLAVWVPSLTGFVLTAHYAGRAGLRELVSRIVRWRVGLWALYVLVGIPLFYLVTDWILYAVLQWPQGSPHYSLYLSGWIVALGHGAILLDPGPIGEEVGWRGFAFPRLLQVMPFWRAELVLGTLWGLWHIPAFYIAATGQSTLSMGWFILGAICLSFVMGTVYVGTGGSVLFAGFVVHYFANQLPDLGGKIVVEVVRFALLAAVLAWVGRGTRRGRARNEIEVVASEA